MHGKLIKFAPGCKFHSKEHISVASVQTYADSLLYVSKAVTQNVP